MNEKKHSTVKRILGTRGMGAVITAFAGLIIIYVAFGLIDRKVFAGQNVMNLLRSMSKYLLIGVGQSYLLITGNIDLSIGSMVGMSAMIRDPRTFTIQAKCYGYEVKAGTYELNTSKDSKELIDILKESPEDAAKEDTKS